MYLSICVTIKNRSYVKTQHGVITLFPNCLQSINDSLSNLKIPTELIITDWESTDCNLYDYLHSIEFEIPTEVVTIKSNDQFSVGMGRNIAAQKSIGDILFFLDADVTINENSLKECIKIVNTYGACYPTIAYQKTYNQSHYDIHEGGGNVLIKRELFEKTNKWPEYWSYGFEDTEFAKDLKKHTKLHTCDDIFVHQWHPKKIGWKNIVDKKATPVKIYNQQKMNLEVDNIKKHINNMINAPNVKYGRQPKKGEIKDIRL